MLLSNAICNKVTKFKFRVFQKLLLLLSVIVVTLVTADVKAQERDTFKLFRFGLRATAGFSNVESVNKLANNWFAEMEDTQGDLVQYQSAEMPSINFEYGFQNFFTFRPWKYLQVGAKVDFIKSPNLYNIEHKDNLDITIVSAIPGVFSLLTLRAFEIGAGPIWGISEVQWNDSYFGYKDNWRGHNMGFEIYIGASFPIRDYMGFSFQIVYRYLHIKKLKDSYDRVLLNSEDQTNFQMNLSGVLLNFGLYFRAIDIGQ